MLEIFPVTFPFFAVVLIGFLAVRYRALPMEAIPGLNVFVLYFALPCMLYRFGASTPVAELMNPEIVGIYLVSALLLVALTVSTTLGPRIDWNNAAFGALTAAFPNTGYMGLPLLVALLGPRAAGPTLATLVVDMLVTSSLCIGLSRLSGARGSGVVAARILRGVLANPLPWAIVLGAASSALGLVPAGPLSKTVALLADAASPVALFTIGAVLARAQMAATGPMPRADYLPLAAVKLMLHPLLVLAIGHGAIRWGFAVDPFSLTVIALAAALPSASNVAMLAERYGADSARVARVILVSTGLAFVTFSTAVKLLG